MKSPLLNAYLHMLPRLQAEENLALVLAVGAGTGSLKKTYHRRYVDGLLRFVKRRKAKTLEDLKQAGMEIVEEEKVA